MESFFKNNNNKKKCALNMEKKPGQMLGLFSSDLFAIFIYMALQYHPLIQSSNVIHELNREYRDARALQFWGTSIF